MGLLNKIKNVLFEEEEIEIPVFKKEEKPKEKEPVVSRPKREVEVKKPVVKEEKPKEEKVSKKPEPKIQKPKIEEDNERETFKTEPTFQFPVFDEEEFNEVPKRIDRLEKTKKERKKVDFGRFNSPKVKEEPKKFVPSPVISPVYGILDKNYNKKDLIKKTSVKEKVVDVDTIRAKAYGTLEEQIESTFSKSTNDFYQEEKPEKTINELLIDSATEEIPVDDIMLDENDEFNTDLSLDVLDEIKKDNNSDIEDTLESDLFNLIDSMYTDKEDE